MSGFETFISFLIVFLLASAELWIAIPVGFALKLHPMLIAISSSAGSICGGFFVLLLGKNLREWLINKCSFFKPRESIQKVWNRYGVIGLGILAPLLTGIPLGVAIGIALGAKANILMKWISAGAILWTAILTIACMLGFEIYFGSRYILWTDCSYREV